MPRHRRVWRRGQHDQDTRATCQRSGSRGAIGETSQCVRLIEHEHIPRQRFGDRMISGRFT